MATDPISQSAWNWPSRGGAMSEELYRGLDFTWAQSLEDDD